MAAVIGILYDHPDFVVVNKPSDVAVQNEQNQSGILPALCQQLKFDKLWLVHRLDKVTSGILILAKHADAAATFGRMFEQKQIDKYYLAVSTKKPKKKQGTVKGGMEKVRDGIWMLNKTDNNLAHSEFFSFSVLSKVRLFVVKPLTGKTHQIRVALKSLGSPILGDGLYKADASDRVYLHAYCVKFEYKGQDITVTCPPTAGEHFTTPEFKHALDNSASPWLLQWPSQKPRQAIK